MLYFTSLSYIGFVPYVYFKTKHNLYLNKHALNRFTHFLDIMLIFFR